MISDSTLSSIFITWIASFQDLPRFKALVWQCPCPFPAMLDPQRLSRSCCLGPQPSMTRAYEDQHVFRGEVELINGEQREYLWNTYGIPMVVTSISDHNLGYNPVFYPYDDCSTSHKNCWNCTPLGGSFQQFPARGFGRSRPWPGRLRPTMRRVLYGRR